MTTELPPSASSLPTCPVVGFPLAVATYDQAVQHLQEQALRRDRAYLAAAASSHQHILARHDRQFGRALAAFDIAFPDGMPLVWAMNLQLKQKLKDRVYGPTLMLRCLEAMQGEAYSHLLIGGTDEMLEVLKANLLAKFPRLQIAGAYAPPFGNWGREVDDRVVELARTTGANVVWIGLGCPKQETLLARNRDRLPPALYCVVGAAFPFHAGRVKQAPPWMQKRGLEWVFRLLSEPQRLWKRYLVFNSLYFYYLLRDSILGSPARPAPMISLQD